jgi:hypothetical protein
MDIAVILVAFLSAILASNRVTLIKLKKKKTIKIVSYAQSNVTASLVSNRQEKIFQKANIK